MTAGLKAPRFIDHVLSSCPFDFMATLQPPCAKHVYGATIKFSVSIYILLPKILLRFSFESESALPFPPKVK